MDIAARNFGSNTAYDASYATRWQDFTLKSPPSSARRRGTPSVQTRAIAPDKLKPNWAGTLQTHQIAEIHTMTQSPPPLSALKKTEAFIVRMLIRIIAATSNTRPLSAFCGLEHAHLVVTYC